MVEPRYEKYEFPGGTVEHIKLSLPSTAESLLSGSTNTPVEGWQFLVKTPGVVDYVHTVPALQKLLGPKFVEMERVI
jgi:hypothetical protein